VTNRNGRKYFLRSADTEVVARRGRRGVSLAGTTILCIPFARLPVGGAPAGASRKLARRNETERASNGARSARRDAEITSNRRREFISPRRSERARLSGPLAETAAFCRGAAHCSRVSRDARNSRVARPRENKAPAYPPSSSPAQPPPFKTGFLRFRKIDGLRVRAILFPPLYPYKPF